MPDHEDEVEKMLLYLISIAVKTGQAELWRALFAEMLQNHRAWKKNTSDEHANDQ